MGRSVLSACLLVFALSFTSAAGDTLPTTTSPTTPSATPLFPPGKATAGKAIAYAMPLVAGGIALWKDDWTGMAQLAVVTTLTVGTAYGIKHLVRECRPFEKPCTHGGPGWDSFPSTTSALASAPSSFIWNRYGWEWGLPLFIISKYTSYSLDKARQNHLGRTGQHGARLRLQPDDHHALPTEECVLYEPRCRTGRHLRLGALHLVINPNLRCVRP